MGLYDRGYYRDEEDRQGFFMGGGGSGSRPIYATLMIINIVIFLANTLFLNNQLNDILAVSSADLKNPLFYWRFLTAGFAHDTGIGHILGNMIGLFFFGRVIEQTYGRNRFLAFYLTAIILGNLGFAVRGLMMGSTNPVIGASGGVTATIILFALRHPRQTVLMMMVIPMPAWVLGIFIVVSDLMTSYDRNSNVAADVHLIGAAYGFLYFKTGWDLTTLGLSRLLSFKMPRRRPKVRIYDPQSRHGNLDQLADQLLEKVHREGQDSLTPKERRILEDYSRKMKQKHS